MGSEVKTFISNLLANVSNISKALVSAAQTSTTCLTTHSWTGVPSIISYVMTALVYFVPNQKAGQVIASVSGTAQEVAAAVVSALQPKVATAEATVTKISPPASGTF
jgi:hypothetical protein